MERPGTWHAADPCTGVMLHASVCCHERAECRACPLVKGPTVRVSRQALQVDSANALAEERDREVRNILQSIADLGQIMKDLSVLVIDQGTILDRIDYNMEQARRPAFLRDPGKRALPVMANAGKRGKRQCVRVGGPEATGPCFHCLRLLCRWRPRSTRV